MGRQHTYFNSKSIAYFLGNSLGMGTLCRPIYPVYLYHRIYPILYLPLKTSVDLEQQLSNIKLRFFTDISHELRTPLTLIASPVTEILENEPLSSKAREHLTLVHKNNRTHATVGKPDIGLPEDTE